MEVSGAAFIACIGFGLLLCAGCASYDPLETERGCAAYAIGTCQTYARCSPTLLGTYGSFEGCQAQLSNVCSYGLQQPDVLGSGAGAQACGELMAQLDCNALYNSELPRGCQPPAGRRGDGAPCAVSAQCASTRCKKATSDAATGTCEEPAALAEPCLGFGDCRLGLVCGTQGSCVALALQGQPCSDTGPCRAPLVCLGGICTQQPKQPEQPTGTVPPMPDPHAVCEDFGRTLCTRLQTCSKFLVQATYGSLDACATRTAQVCLDNFMLPDTTTSADGLAGCSAALSDVDCRALLENNLPDACQLAAGARADGRACAVDAQCMNMRCARTTSTDRCGVCAARAQTGQSCLSNTDCQPGLICAGDGNCKAPAPAGATCDTTQPCSVPLVCAGGTCQSALALQQNCDTTADRCDGYAGLSCDYVTKRCTAWLPSAAGQPCGYTAQGWMVCTGGATCTSDSLGSTCQASLPDGTSCQPDGPACIAPARCVGGVCTLGSGGDCA